ncbi:MAG: hypothetical protein HC831_16655 [Chloroflexia bacterium]|nr:hypothetical protein [Chloroflexia bacterium]
MLNIDEIKKPSKGQKLINKIRESDLIKMKSMVREGEAIPIDRNKS